MAICSWLYNSVILLFVRAVSLPLQCPAEFGMEIEYVYLTSADRFQRFFGLVNTTCSYRHNHQVLLCDLTRSMYGYQSTFETRFDSCTYFYSEQDDIEGIENCVFALTLFASIFTVFIILCSLLPRCYKIVKYIYNFLTHYLYVTYELFTLCVNAYYSPIDNGFLTTYISLLMYLTKQPKFAACTMRSTFNKLINIKSGAASNHTHPNAAMDRNNSSTFIDLFARVIGTNAYYLQRSAADVRNGRDGARSYHWAKDFTAEGKLFNPKQDDLISIIDVDMYLDMPRLLSNYPQMYIISTFQPESVSCDAGEFVFTFDEHNNVIYNVSGGAKYMHPVWNYGNDIIMSRRLTWYGMYCYTVYNIDRRKTSSHHELIFLTPVKSVNSWLIPIGDYLQAQMLRRLEVVTKIENENFLRLKIMKKDGMYTSTGRPYSLACTTIKSSDDDTIAGMSRIGKTALTVAQIKTAIEDVPQQDAVILTEFHRLKDSPLNDVVYPLDESVYKFQYLEDGYDPESKPSLVPFMSPFKLGCFAPDLCKSNDIEAIQGRITAVKNTTEATPELIKYMAEFLSFLIPDSVAGTGVPEDFDDVFDKQARPSQRAILNGAAMLSKAVVKEPIKSFQKSEAYSKVTSPRIISTIPGTNKLNYSRYTYSFTKLLRLTKWYAFGKTPYEVAERVALICLRAIEVFVTDFSRMDGRVAPALRLLEHMALMRFFKPEFQRELAELAASQQNQRGYTKFGVKYETGTTRCSGSPETADFNSMDNGFTGYVAKRKTKKAGVFLSPQEAWDELGIYGGDDGLTADVDPIVYAKVAESVGQVLELDLYKRGSPGVNFLARIYSPEVWFGSLNSMCDVNRQLTKYHVTTVLAPNVTPILKLCEKAVAYGYTDLHTPIIGDISKLVHELFPMLKNKEIGSLPLRGVAYAHAVVAAPGETNVQYPNVYGDWMLDVINHQLPNFDMGKFKRWCDSVRADGSLLLKPPLCDETEVKHNAIKPMVINDNLVGPKLAAKVKPPDKTKERPKPHSLGPCKLFAAGDCKYRETCIFKH